MAAPIMASAVLAHLLKVLEDLWDLGEALGQPGDLGDVHCLVTDPL
jgi:hypothetical protein